MAKLKLTKNLKKLASAAGRFLLRVLRSPTCTTTTTPHTTAGTGNDTPLPLLGSIAQGPFRKQSQHHAAATQAGHPAKPARCWWTWKRERASSHISTATKKGYLPIVCVGAASCKRYTIAVHQLRSPVLVRMLGETALEYGYGFSNNRRGALAIACEPHTFEATFCLLQRSCEGLVHNPPNSK